MAILRFFTFSLCVVCLLILPGCKKSKGVRVEGTVTVQGELVDKGVIQFVAVDGSTAEAGGTIKGGKFVVTVVPPGEKIVRIRGSRVTGKRKVDPAPSWNANQGRTYEKEDAQGNFVEVDVEVPLTSRKDHWDQSQLRETITTKTKKLEFKL